MTAEFVSGPADKAAPAPTPDGRIRWCGRRSGGHRWLLVGEPGEDPYLLCEDCPGDSDDAYPDLLSLLSGPVDIGGQTVVFGEVLPDDAEPYSIPVHVAVEETRDLDPSYGLDCDAKVSFTPREVAS